MGSLDRVEDLSGRPFKADPIELSEGLLHFPSTPPSTAARGCGAAIDLVYQAAELIRGIESHANETEKSFADALKKLQLAEKRIEELEKDLHSARACISEARVKIKNSDEAAKTERARLEAAEKRMSQIEMRARTAEAQAKENANAVTRIEEAIRTQLLAKRPPLNKRTSAA